MWEVSKRIGDIGISRMDAFECWGDKTGLKVSSEMALIVVGTS